MARLDLSNKVFGNLIVIKYAYTINNCVFWEGICSCGKITFVKTKYLNNGDTKSCGCLKKPHEDSYYLTNKFGMLKPISKIIKNWKGYYHCLCDCGNACLVLSSNLLSGNTTSCGCINIYTEKELVGKKFGYIIINSIISGKAIGICDCGKAVSINCFDIASGNTTSCGCKRKTEAKLRWIKKSYTKEHILYLRRLVSASDRKKIYARDNFKCQICSNSNYLQMHHIIPMKENNSLESIFNPDNCITLCKICHYQIAHGNTTKDINTNIQTFLLWRITNKHRS